MDDAEHVVDEDGGVDLRFAGALEGLVVALLVLPDEVLCGEPGEHGPPPSEDEGLPEAADAPVAVAEGVDVFDEEVDGAGDDEGVVAGGGGPLEELGDEPRNLRCPGPGVDDLACRVHDVHVHGAEGAGLLDEPAGEHGMGSEEVVDAPRVEAGQGIVGCESVLVLLDFPGWRQHGLSFGQGFDLREGHLVAFDGGGGLHGPQAVRSSELDAAPGLFFQEAHAAEQLDDLVDLLPPFRAGRVEGGDHVPSSRKVSSLSR